jgi:hypothetical protein
MKRLEWLQANAVVGMMVVGFTLFSGANGFAKGGGHSHGGHTHSSKSHTAKSHHETHHAAPAHQQAHHAAPAHHETHHAAPNQHGAPLVAGRSHVATHGATASPAVTHGAHHHHHGWNNGYWNNGYWDGWGVGPVVPGVDPTWYYDGFYYEGPLMGGSPAGRNIAPAQANAAILPAPSSPLVRRPASRVDSGSLDENDAP